MNYETYIKQTYIIDSDYYQLGDTNGAIMCLANGETHYADYLGALNSDYMSPFDNVVYYYSNYANQHYNSYLNILVYYSAFSDNLYVITRDICDYLITDSYNSTIGLVLCKLFGEDNAPLEDLNAVTNYMTYNSNSAFTSYTYGEQRVSNMSNNQKVITDFSNISSPLYTDYQLVVRGENVTFNKYVLELPVNTYANLKLSYGSPYYDIRQQGYESGYSNGYASGYVQGQQYGFEVGMNSHVDQTTYTAFGYIGQAFNCVSDILSIEVLPHITLGLCFSIPLTLVLIMTIFKLVKK